MELLCRPLPITLKRARSVDVFVIIFFTLVLVGHYYMYLEDIDYSSTQFTVTTCVLTFLIATYFRDYLFHRMIIHNEGFTIKRHFFDRQFLWTEISEIKTFQAYKGTPVLLVKVDGSHNPIRRWGCVFGPQFVHYGYYTFPCELSVEPKIFDWDMELNAHKIAALLNDAIQQYRTNSQ